MANYYDIPLKYKSGTGVARGIGNNAAWQCVCGTVLLGPHEAIYAAPPCPKCNRRYAIRRGSKPLFVSMVEEV